MRLIDADLLLYLASEHCNKIIGIDGFSTFGAFLDLINKQRPLLRNIGADEFVIAPCPKCGSGEIVIDIEKREYGYHEFYYGEIRCLSCKRLYGVYAPKVQDVYRKWNNDFVKLNKEVNGKEEAGGETDAID